jgi:hypothetical protein
VRPICNYSAIQKERFLLVADGNSYILAIIQGFRRETPEIGSFSRRNYPPNWSKNILNNLLRKVILYVAYSQKELFSFTNVII